MRSAGSPRCYRAAFVLVSAVMGIGLAACGGGKVAIKTTTTLPPLPPSVVALVTLAGTGANVGDGHVLMPVTLNAAPGASTLGTRIGVGTYPDAVAVNPAGTEAYVANFSANTVTPIDLKDDVPGTPIPAGTGPADIAIAPDGKTAYVTDDGTLSTLDDQVTPINLTTDKPGTPITVGAGPQGIAITPDGSTAYVADAGAIVAGQAGAIGHTVTPIDLATGKAERPVAVGNGPTGVAITPDGSTVFVTNLDSGSVSPISTATNTASAAVAVPGGPIAVAVAAGSAWVVDAPSSTSPKSNVVPISLATEHTGTPIAVGAGAQDIAIAPGGKTAWVTCLTANMLYRIDLATRRAGAPIRVPGGPFALAVVDEVES